MAEVDLDILGQCEMMLKDVVQKNKVAVQGLKQIEVFRQVSSRLPKLLKEEVEINSRLRGKSEQEKAIDGVIDKKLKAGEEWVDREKGKLDKELIDYRGKISVEMDRIKGDKDFVQSEYINMRERVDKELGDIKDELKVAKDELKDIETARDSVRQSIGEMAKTVGVKVK